MSIIALLIGLILPALGSARHNAVQMESNTRLRGIHHGCVQYADGNGQKYPGLGHDPNLRKVSERFERLLPGDYFTAEYMVSSLEALQLSSAVVTTDNCSYAMLNIANTSTNRRNEWATTGNSEGTVISDRSLKQANSGLPTTSVHVTTTTSDSTDWHGGVCWNDNHVTFERSGILDRILYGTGKFTNDDLFEDSRDNALMAWN